MVLTFRNLHNWIGDQRKDGMSASLAFRAMYDALKPGGILGITDHRWPEDSSDADPFNTGYMKASEAIALAEAAGFKLEARSEINANALDTRNYDRGSGRCRPAWRWGTRTGKSTSL